MVRLAPDKNEPEAASEGFPSVPVMTGTHFHALDEKGRVIIPAKLRPALTDQFWMILDENDNVGIYNYQTGLDILEHCERMIAENPGDEDIAAAVERITGAADLVAAEGGYRVPVPEILRFYAELDKEVVTVGVLNHAVLWSRVKWEAAQTRRLQSPEVRKAQANMLRAAASGIRKKQPEEQQVVTPEVEVVAVEREVAALATGTGGEPRRAGTGTSGAGKAAPAASAGDGERGSRLLTLSQLGR
jgi:MraZ protein